MITIPKGTKDVLPSQSHKWQHIEAAAKKLARLYNAREIRTPIFEHTELFERGVGEETEVVSKQMYTFLDKKERSITLKAEGTAPVVRSFIENTLEQSEGLPLKLFYFSPVFRYETPQAGRYRQHHQFGIEMFGSQSHFADAEVISIAYNFLCNLGVSGVLLRLNSIGCPNCRAEYNKALRHYLQANTACLCANCRQRLQTNTLRVLDCKEENCKKILQNSPSILQYLCPECDTHFTGLKSVLTSLEIPFEVDSKIVRGLDYYTKTVFEFVSASIGSQTAICGGGRYDGMVEALGGRATPCVGFGMGIERLIMVMEALNLPFGESNSPTIYLAPCGENERQVCIELAKTLRQNNISCETDFMGRSVKAQLKYADKIGAKYVAVIGENELKSGEVSLKCMSQASVQSIKLSDLVHALARL